MRDPRLQPPLPRQLHQRLHIGERERGVNFIQPADAHADGIDALDQQIVAADIGGTAAEEPQYEQNDDYSPDDPGLSRSRNS